MPQKRSGSSGSSGLGSDSSSAMDSEGIVLLERSTGRAPPPGFAHHLKIAGIAKSLQGFREEVSVLCTMAEGQAGMQV